MDDGEAKMRDSEGTVLLTGFEPYGGRGRNPAAAVAQALDGCVLAGRKVRGVIIPVTLRGLEQRLEALIGEQSPELVLCLGLYPGESAIRLERFGVNLADFEIADNAGARPVDEPLSQDGPTALTATLPLRRILSALLEAGIPAHISNSAGTYLCNAALFTALMLTRQWTTPAGFIHLPYLPDQVADLLAGGDRESSPAGPPPSMAQATMEAAVRLAIENALRD